MSPFPPDALLDLLAAVGDDHGAAALGRLTRLLRAEVAFDAAELCLWTPAPVRRPLDGTPPVADEALLRAAASAPEPLRFDSPEAAGARFPATRAAMEARGLRSALALPCLNPGVPPGTLVLFRAHGWAFAGARLYVLGPVARAAGLALSLSLRLSGVELGAAGEPGRLPDQPAEAPAKGEPPRAAAATDVPGAQPAPPPPKDADTATRRPGRRDPPAGLKPRPRR